jgi:hypothetical protein
MTTRYAVRYQAEVFCSFFNGETPWLWAAPSQTKTVNTVSFDNCLLFGTKEKAEKWIENNSSFRFIKTSIIEIDLIIPNLED